MNSQQLFNQAVAGLAGQGFERSVSHQMTIPSAAVGCLYRGLDGKKCAVGHLIPDDQYDPKMEGRVPGFELDGTLRIGSIRVPALDGSDARLVYMLQDAHDHSDTPKQMKKALYELAFMFDLQPPAVLTAG